jgi:hypothetical protein
MSVARANVESAKSSKEDQNKVVAKANQVVGALLTPSRHVVNLLSELGALFPPCKQVSSTLAVSDTSWLFRSTSLTHPLHVQALIKNEVSRNEKDVRVAIVHFDLVCYSSGRCSCHLVLNAWAGEGFGAYSKLESQVSTHEIHW